MAPISPLFAVKGLARVMDRQRTHGAGLSESEARLVALRQFGPVSVAKEQCRDMRRVNFVADLVKDFAYAFRLLKKCPESRRARTWRFWHGSGALSGSLSGR
jgi:hypothetical protein